MQRKEVLPNHLPRLIAIVGGSGAGKTHLADQLQQRLGKEASRLSLDNFYRDRSRLPLRRRQQINFDHPRAIDWKTAENVLENLARNHPAWMPRYDFSNHARAAESQLVKPKSIILVDGLWLLQRRVIRKFFDYTIFLDCPARTRLRRRLVRDLKQRARTAASVRQQFLRTVAPMHKKFVAPQRRLANVIFRHDPSPEEITKLAKTISIHAKSNSKL